MGGEDSENQIKYASEQRRNHWATVFIKLTMPLAELKHAQNTGQMILILNHVLIGVNNSFKICVLNVISKWTWKLIIKEKQLKKDKIIQFIQKTFI